LLVIFIVVSRCMDSWMSSNRNVSFEKRMALQESALLYSAVYEWRWTLPDWRLSLSSFLSVIGPDRTDTRPFDLEISLSCIVPFRHPTLSRIWTWFSSLHILRILCPSLIFSFSHSPLLRTFLSFCLRSLTNVLSLYFINFSVTVLYFFLHLFSACSKVLELISSVR
jgi:hypothetical protein